jgi:hypothetical protein
MLLRYIEMKCFGSRLPDEPYVAIAIIGPRGRLRSSEIITVEEAKRLLGELGQAVTSAEARTGNNTG